MNRSLLHLARLGAACWLAWHAASGAAYAQAAEGPQDPKAACAAAAERGQTDRDEGRLLDARRQLLTCADDACPAIVRRSCAQWLSEIESRIPSIVLRVVDASDRDLTRASVSVDGAPIALDGRPIALDPGQHRIEVKVEQKPRPTAYEFLAVEGESTRLVRIELADSAPTAAQVAAAAALSAPAPSKQPRDSSFVIPTGAWILAGTSALALGSFAYFGVSAANDRADLAHDCSPTCTRAQTRSARDKALAADLALGIGLATLAGSVAWVWLAQPSPARPDVSASIAPVPGGAVATLRTRL